MLNRTEREYMKERPLLTEVLRKADRDIKVGTEFGYSYWFIGSVDDFLEHADSLSEKFRKMFKPIPGTVESFVPIIERRVADVFYADTIVDDTMVIVIEGTENGRTWFKGDELG